MKVVVAEVEKNVELEPEDINEAIRDIFISATNEVKRFNSEAFVKKTSTEKNGVFTKEDEFLRVNNSFLLVDLKI